MPDDAAPNAARNAIVSTLTLNSSMILRKISGSRNAWAWLTAWAIARSQSDFIGWIRGPDRGVSWGSVAGTGSGQGVGRGSVAGSSVLMAAPSRASWTTRLGHSAGVGGSAAWPRLAPEPARSKDRARSIAPEQTVAGG